MPNPRAQYKFSNHKTQRCAVSCELLENRRHFSASPPADPMVTFATSVTSIQDQNWVSGSPARGSVKLRITNSGNIPSTGLTDFVITASATAGIEGTPFPSVSKYLTIGPGKSINVTIPLRRIPSVAGGNYFLVVQVFDPVDQEDAEASSASPVSIAAPVMSLTPSFSSNAELKPGPGHTLNAVMTVTNTGNVTSTGISQILYFAQSAFGTLTLVADRFISLAIPPGKSKRIPIHLPPAMAGVVTSAGLFDYYLTFSLDVEVINPQGGAQSASVEGSIGT